MVFIFLRGEEGVLLRTMVLIQKKGVVFFKKIFVKSGFFSGKPLMLIQKRDFESVWVKHHDAYKKNECNS